MAKSPIYDEPFTPICETLWAMINAETGFTDLVTIGNRVTFLDEEDSDPLKANPTSADFPELLLVADGWDESNFRVTSNSSEVKFNVTWQVSTNDFRSKQVFVLQWMLYRALSRWCDSGNLTSLLWPALTGTQYVKHLAIGGMEQGFSVGSRSKALQRMHGWTAILPCKLLLRFSTSEL